MPFPESKIDGFSKTKNNQHKAIVSFGGARDSVPREIFRKSFFFFYSKLTVHRRI